MRIVVCKLYQLYKLNNAYTLEQKKLERQRCVVSEDYVNLINGSYKDHGKFYEIDETATTTYYEQSKQQIENKAAEAEAKSEKVVSAVSDALTEVIEKRGRKPKQN